MSGINTDLNSVPGSGLNPAELTDGASVGTPTRQEAQQTVVEDSSAALVDISDGASAPTPEADIPSDISAATELASSLSAQIRQHGSSASAAHTELSGNSTFKLTQP